MASVHTKLYKYLESVRVQLDMLVVRLQADLICRLDNNGAVKRDVPAKWRSPAERRRALPANPDGADAKYQPVR